MKSLIACAAFSLFSVANASFELLLVADNGENTFATRRDHRCDPATGTYLGNFGGFNGEIVSTHLNRASNSLLVFATNGLTEWDYNTGLQKNAFAHYAAVAVGHAVRPTMDRMALLNGSTDLQLGSFPVPGNFNQTGALANAAYRRGFWTSNTTLIAFESTHARFVMLTSNTGATSGTMTDTSDLTGPSIG